MVDQVVRLLQVTDLHLQSEPIQLMKGVNVEERFCRVLQHLSVKPADALILTGDLSHHASAAYARIVDYVQPLPFPTYWLPGNHDLPGEMYQFSERGLGSKVVEVANWRILLLDSTANPDGHGGGSLSEPELEFLQTELAITRDDQFVLIALHHNPVSVQSVWQDSIGLANAAQFWSVLEGFPQVRGVIFGHVHQDWHIERQGIPLFSSPATAPQFKKCTVQPEAESDPSLVMPGYAYYQLHPDGNIECQVERIS